MRHGGACGHRPVDLANVVLARDVDPGIADVRAGSGQQAEVVAVQEPLEATHDGELQAAQRSLRRELVQRDGGPGRRTDRPRQRLPCSPRGQQTAPEHRWAADNSQADQWRGGNLA